MLDARTYAITELVELSGFDRRTIVYYLHQDLLPRAGRRGPRTRYPEECLIRLRVIRGLKEHQDQGRSGTITLAEMRHLLDRTSAAELRALLERHLPLDEIRPLLAPAQIAAAPAPEVAPASPDADQPNRPTVGDGRSYGLADAGIRNRGAARPPSLLSGAPRPATAPGPSGPAPSESGTPSESAAELERSLGELLRELEMRPSLTQRRVAPGAAEQWTEIPITSRVFVSVRGLSENDAPLADAVGRALKKLLRAR